jgi:two-component system, OmpR family, sensor histidine kinase MtrB
VTTIQATVIRWWHTGVDALSKGLRALRYSWLRSIQARVVIGTLVLSAIVISLVGWMLTRQVADGLTDSKREQSISEARAGVQLAQQQLDEQPVVDTSSQSALLTQLVSSLAQRGGTSRNFELMLAGPIGPGFDAATGSGFRRSPGLSRDSLPEDLLEQVAANDGLYWTYSEMTYQDSDQTSPAVVVGSRIKIASSGDEYGLFYLFPMDDQAETLAFVKRGMVSAGIVLLALIAAVAWLVTRQVVTPVRLARRIAERLAAGRLEERMQVRGQDDIARLGISFNQMAASLQRQIRQLEELSRMQRRFVSDVSHELRTPLTTVRMAADVLHDTRANFDPATARAAELLQAELDRFESLLTDLLEVSRFDAGAARLDLETVDLAELADRAGIAYEALAERRGASLRVVVGGRPCLVEADARRLDRIIRNLVVNAISYSQSDEIVVRVAGDDQAVALTVRDWGIGLHPGEATLVFNRFWRADPARARGAGGTGLGLAIALEDAQLHGGWLQAWGEPDQGAQFRLTLPRRAGGELRRSPLPLVPRDEPELRIGQAYERLDLGAGEPS